MANDAIVTCAHCGSNRTVRDALAKIVAAFTSGVSCANCGMYVTDCECIINVGYRALYPENERRRPARQQEDGDV